MASSNTQAGNSSPDPAIILKEIADTVYNYVLESIHGFQDYIAQPQVRYWLRIIVIVAAYIMVRPLIELLFKKWFERTADKEDAERKKKEEEQEAQLIAEGLKRPKRDANSVRVGGSSGNKTSNDGDASKSAAGDSKAVQDSKSNNTDNVNNKNNNKTDNDNNEYDNSDDEDYAEKIKASGVLEWGRDARRRQKKNVRIEAENKNKELDEEKLLELLDWSEDEADGQRKK